MIDLTQYEHQLIELCKKFSVKQLYIVGSAAREDFDLAKSDIDMLVDFQGKDNLFHRYFDLKFDLEALVERKVDMIQISAVKNPYIRESLEKDRVRIYES